jgi:hydroxymethylpyrimidine pyrophosphatase-like HAD family hydrolase
MLKAADIGIAVGNARPEAKAVADLIIDTNDNDGVAKYLLNEFKERNGD